MTRRRWIADEVSGDEAALVGEHADHLARVLRARIGQQFDISTGDRVRRGFITKINDARVEFRLGEEIVSPASLELTLVLSIFKFDRMEWAIEKCTELGVSRILPVIARRTDSHLASASTKRSERWLRIAREAAEQSRQVSPPEIATPVKLSQILNFDASLRVVLAENERGTSLPDILRNLRQGNKQNITSPNEGVALAIGPEGGWTEDELHAFEDAGWVAASLGDTILRAETAAIAATAVVAAYR
jgi:16S rRNA (uracil1498-N3)-methyltransferase